jgi:hypothetical protein
VQLAPVQEEQQYKENLHKYLAFPPFNFASHFICFAFAAYCASTTAVATFFLISTAASDSN